jgi:hypothetical protein
MEDIHLERSGFIVALSLQDVQKVRQRGRSEHEAEAYGTLKLRVSELAVFFNILLNENF